MLAAYLFLAASGHAVILSGDKDKATAEEYSQKWSAVESVVQAAGLKTQQGYPKLVHSDDVKGLKPGFWIWVLGFCDQDEAAAQLALIGRVFNGAYSRPVEVAKLECASLAEEAGFGKDAKLGKVGAFELRSIETTDSTEDESGEGRDASYDRTIIHVMLYDPKRKAVVDSVPINGAENHSYGMSSGGGGFSCTMKIGAIKGKKLVLVRHCRSPSPECGSYAGGRETTTVTIDGSSLSADMEKEDLNYVECD